MIPTNEKDDGATAGASEIPPPGRTSGAQNEAGGTPTLRPAESTSAATGAFTFPPPSCLSPNRPLLPSSCHRRAFLSASIFSSSLEGLGGIFFVVKGDSDGEDDTRIDPSPLVVAVAAAEAEAEAAGFIPLSFLRLFFLP